MPELPPLPVRIHRLLSTLRRLYPEAYSELQTNSPLQVLIATILSAQCTDVRVNQVTPQLFARYPTAKAFSEADRAELEEVIFPTGFYRNKAKNIQASCRILCEKYAGEVPSTLEELIQLPGIGRKTANCVLGDAFATPGITVDTHVGRLSRRLGLSTKQDPVKVEADLMQIIPRKEWTPFSHRLIFHGRRVCTARKPRCSECSLLPICPQVGVVSGQQTTHASLPSEQSITRAKSAQDGSATKRKRQTRPAS